MYEPPKIINFYDKLKTFKLKALFILLTLQESSLKFLRETCHFMVFAQNELKHAKMIVQSSSVCINYFSKYCKSFIMITTVKLFFL